MSCMCICLRLVNSVSKCACNETLTQDIRYQLSTDSVVYVARQIIKNYRNLFNIAINNTRYVSHKET